MFQGKFSSISTCVYTDQNNSYEITVSILSSISSRMCQQYENEDIQSISRTFGDGKLISFSNHGGVLP